MPPTSRAHALSAAPSPVRPEPGRCIPGCFVTGTDTAAGKTIVAAALAAAMARSGRRVAALKPVLTGCDDAATGPWPRDHELLAEVTGSRPQSVVSATFGPAVSPHLAAELAGDPIDLGDLAASIAKAAADADALVVEGVGGLLVPLGSDRTVRDLAVALGLPLVVAARPGLGTINHTLLTIEAARTVGLDVRAVVFTPWPAQPSGMHRSNLETVARMGEVATATLPCVARADLARAGADLPYQPWLGPYFSAATSTIKLSISHSTGARSSV